MGMDSWEQVGKMGRVGEGGTVFQVDTESLVMIHLSVGDPNNRAERLRMAPAADT